MHLSTSMPILRRDRASRRRHEAHTPRHVVSPAEARARRSGGPQDHALYRCGCGYAFKAEVSTSVGCPQCGTNQDW